MTATSTPSPFATGFAAGLATTTGTSISPGDRELAHAIDTALEDMLRLDPVQSSQAGHHAHDGTFADFSEPGRRSRRRTLAGHAHLLEGRGAVDPDIELDRKLMIDELHVLLRTEEDIDPARRNPAIYADEVLNGINLLLMRPPLQNRLGALLGRLREVSRVLSQAKSELDPADVPRIFAETGIAIARAGLPLLAEAVPQAVQAAVGDTPLAAAVSAAAGEAALALGSYANFIEEHILPRAEGEFAAGDSYFTFLLHHKHGILQSPDELLLFGQREVERIGGALTDLAARMATRLHKNSPDPKAASAPATPAAAPDAQADWRAVLQELERRGAIATAYPGCRLVEVCREMCDRARQAVAERVCPMPADEVLDIVETPEFARPTTPFAAYWPPPPLAPEADSELRGVFWATPGGKISSGELLLTCVHEAYPGHHMQFCHSARTGSRARKVLGTPVFWEGWALYCEALCREFDLSAPGQTVAHPDELLMYILRSQLWRAYRVVLDVSLHCKGMSFAAAVEVLSNGLGFTKEDAEGEVRRYVAGPTYPLTYLVGYNAFRHLRAEAQRKAARDGQTFSLPAFHEQLLSHGSIPLGYLHERLGHARQ